MDSVQDTESSQLLSQQFCNLSQLETASNESVKRGACMKTVCCGRSFKARIRPSTCTPFLMSHCHSPPSSLTDYGHQSSPQASVYCKRSSSESRGWLRSRSAQWPLVACVKVAVVGISKTQSIGIKRPGFTSPDTQTRHGRLAESRRGKSSLSASWAYPIPDVCRMHVMLFSTCCLEAQS